MHTCRIAAAPQKEARKWMEKGTITTTTITTLLPLNHNSVLHAHIFQRGNRTSKVYLGGRKED